MPSIAQLSTVGAVSCQPHMCASRQQQLYSKRCGMLVQLAKLEGAHARCCRSHCSRQPVAPCASPAEKGLRPPHAAAVT